MFETVFSAFDTAFRTALGIEFCVVFATEFCAGLEPVSTFVLPEIISTAFGAALGTETRTPLCAVFGSFIAATPAAEALASVEGTDFIPSVSTASSERALLSEESSSSFSSGTFPFPSTGALGTAPEDVVRTAFSAVFETPFTPAIEALLSICDKDPASVLLL
jgi:hypothetical protein